MLQAQCSMPHCRKRLYRVVAQDTGRKDITFARAREVTRNLLSSSTQLLSWYLMVCVGAGHLHIILDSRSEYGSICAQNFTVTIWDNNLGARIALLHETTCTYHGPTHGCATGQSVDPILEMAPPIKHMYLAKLSPSTQRTCGRPMLEKVSIATDKRVLGMKTRTLIHTVCGTC